MSVAITHLNPMRHCLNLMVRGGVFVRKMIKDLKAVGVEAESGGEVFTVEADRVVLSAGANLCAFGSIRSDVLEEATDSMCCAYRAVAR